MSRDPQPHAVVYETAQGLQKMPLQPGRFTTMALIGIFWSESEAVFAAETLRGRFPTPEGEFSKFTVLPLLNPEHFMRLFP